MVREGEEEIISRKESKETILSFPPQSQSRWFYCTDFVRFVFFSHLASDVWMLRLDSHLSSPSCVPGAVLDTFIETLPHVALSTT